MLICRGRCKNTSTRRTAPASHIRKTRFAGTRQKSVADDLQRASRRRRCTHRREKYRLLGSAQRERARDPGEGKKEKEKKKKHVASPRKEATFPSLRLTSPRIKYALPRQHSNHNEPARSAVAARAEKKKKARQQTIIASASNAAADDKEPHTAGGGFSFFFSFCCNRHLRRK